MARMLMINNDHKQQMPWQNKPCNNKGVDSLENYDPTTMLQQPNISMTTQAKE